MSATESHRTPSNRESDRVISGAAVEGWGRGSIGFNIGLSLLNLSIAVASGSLAVAAEMVHNLVDLMASVAVLLGLKVSRRRSRTFPYGLYKVARVVLKENLQGKGPEYVFANMGVEMIDTGAGTVSLALEALDQRA
jgi:hypothetical protein